MAAKSKQGQKKPNFAQHSEKITVIEVCLCSTILNFQRDQTSLKSKLKVASIRNWML